MIRIIFCHPNTLAECHWPAYMIIPTELMPEGKLFSYEASMPLIEKTMKIPFERLNNYLATNSHE